VCDYDEKGECAQMLDPSQELGEKQFDKRAVLTEKSAGRQGKRSQLISYSDFTDQSKG
jgi:hypothetical protein